MHNLLTGKEKPAEQAAPRPRLENTISRRNSAQIAIQSARIVNAYGSTIQIIGVIIGFIIIIGGFFLASTMHSALVAFFGVVIGTLDIAIFAVQGALFRMISNYVIARLEE